MLLHSLDMKGIHEMAVERSPDVSLSASEPFCLDLRFLSCLIITLVQFAWLPGKHGQCLQFPGSSRAPGIPAGSAVCWGFVGCHLHPVVTSVVRKSLPALLSAEKSGLWISHKVWGPHKSFLKIYKQIDCRVGTCCAFLSAILIPCKRNISILVLCWFILLLNSHTLFTSVSFGSEILSYRSDSQQDNDT